MQLLQEEGQDGIKGEERIECLAGRHSVDEGHLLWLLLVLQEEEEGPEGQVLQAYRPS